MGISHPAKTAIAAVLIYTCISILPVTNAFAGASNEQAALANDLHKEAVRILGLANKSYTNGDYARAESEYELAIEADPGYFQAYMGRANSRYAQGDYRNAFFDYNRALELRPDSEAAYKGRANIRTAMDDLAGALLDYNRACRINPYDAHAVFNRGLLRKRLGDAEGAAGDYARALKIDPGLASANYEEGRKKTRAGDLKGASLAFSRAIELTPSDPMPYVGRGNAYYAMGDMDKSIRDYTKAITLNPMGPLAYIGRGNARGTKGDLKGAYSDYTMAIGLRPDYAASYYNRALVSRRLGDTEGADADLMAAAVLDNTYAKYARNIQTKPLTVDSNDKDISIKAQTARKHTEGTTQTAKTETTGEKVSGTLIVKHEPDSTVMTESFGGMGGDVSDYGKSVTRIIPNPSSRRITAGTFYEEGRKAFSRKDYTGAVRYFNRALDIDHRYVYAYVGLGNIRYETGDYTAALTEYTRAIALDPGEALAYLGRGNARYALGDHRGALADYSKAAAIRPELAASYYNRSLARMGTGDRKGASDDYSEAVALNPGINAKAEAITDEKAMSAADGGNMTTTSEPEATALDTGPVEQNRTDGNDGTPPKGQRPHEALASRNHNSPEQDRAANIRREDLAVVYAEGRKYNARTSGITVNPNSEIHQNEAVGPDSDIPLSALPRAPVSKEVMPRPPNNKGFSEEVTVNGIKPTVMVTDTEYLNATGASFSGTAPAFASSYKENTGYIGRIIELIKGGDMGLLRPGDGLAGMAEDISNLPISTDSSTGFSIKDTPSVDPSAYKITALRAGPVYEKLPPVMAASSIKEDTPERVSRGGLPILMIALLIAACGLLMVLGIGLAIAREGTD